MSAGAVSLTPEFDESPSKLVELTYAERDVNLYVRDVRSRATVYSGLKTQEFFLVTRYNFVPGWNKK